MAATAENITLLLDAIDQGREPAAPERLFPLIYDELRRRAGDLMANERREHTLQPTALVHEAFLKVAKPGVSFQSRLHFFNAAALAMRRILVDHAKARKADKRGGGREGGWHRMSLSEIDADAALSPSVDVLALDEALAKLAELSPRQAQVIQLRFFAGLKDAEIAELLQVTERTVRRDWVAARLWLCDQMDVSCDEDRADSDSKA